MALRSLPTQTRLGFYITPFYTVLLLKCETRSVPTNGPFETLWCLLSSRAGGRTGHFTVSRLLLCQF
uniref:Uncharacterized protein n=1 Tax=Melopsittacus undulatus TaxID=13146 RepID=A0A8V5G118_MELUD